MCSTTNSTRSRRMCDSEIKGFYQHKKWPTQKEVSSTRWFVGMLISSIFSLVYLFTPLYLLVSVTLLLCQYPSIEWSIYFSSPIVLSAIIPPVAVPWLMGWMTPVLDYFQFERIIETKTVDVRSSMLEEKKNYIFAMQPHGVISFGAICLGVSEDTNQFRGRVRTGVASAVLKIPIIKHVMGIFGLTDVSRRNLQSILKKPGIEGSVFLYVGGMAELFKSTRKKEVLYLSKRKGFIKLALQEGVDIVPLYLFGNTSIFTVFKTGRLADLSRKLQVSLTYFWGKWYLPVPRDDKLLYVGGQPLGIPHIPEPTQEEIDHWHKKYCQEVTRIFDKYKELVPAYKHKELIID